MNPRATHPSPRTWSRPPYTLTSDPDRIDTATVLRLLDDSYWAAGRPHERSLAGFRGSLCFSLFCDGEEDQVGFARVISDLGTFAYLADVILVEEHRGRGLGSWMMDCILDTPELRGLPFFLVTRDAQTFYDRFGFGDHPFSILHRPSDWRR